MSPVSTFRELNLSGINEGDRERARAPKIRIASKSTPCTVFLPKWNDVHLLEQLLDRVHQFEYLAHYERTPYETIETSVRRGKNEWIIGSNSQTGRLWVHCKMPGGHGVVVKL